MSPNSEQSNPLDRTPNSDIVNLPTSGRDVQEGAPILTAEEQVKQLSDYFEDNYPEIFAALTTDEGAEFKAAGTPVPPELVDATERAWARAVNLITHTSLLVLGAGLDHRMPQNAYVAAGQVTATVPEFAEQLPPGVRATVITPRQASGAVAISVHGGPGWFGDGASHDQFWLPLFAAIAAQSGVTVVDLTYPLPGYGSWDAAEDAVAQAFDVVKSFYPDAPAGAIAFGSGVCAARRALGAADFVVALSPRVAEVNVRDTPMLVSVAALDTRGIPAAECQRWAEATGAQVTYQEWPSEHVIAAPTVWRERVDAAAAWLRNTISVLSE